MAKGSSSKSLKARLERLNSGNIIVALLLLAQAIAVLAFAKGVSLPVTTNFLTLDSLQSAAANHNVFALATQHLFDIRVVYLVAAFLLVGTILQALSGGLLRRKYEADLKKGINRLRWLEYIIGGGLLMLTLSLINGIYDISTLIAIFGLTEILGLFALLVEAQSELGRHPRVTNKLAFVAWLVPWLVVAFYLFGAIIYGHSLPTYVYWLDGTAFVLVAAKAVNMKLVGQSKGRWADYLYGETVYISIEFVLYTAVTWQIFFGLLR